ncbi:MAG: hypothetical protein Q9183_005157 [Haloplaca sp. 2 TL-2023]
MAAKCTLLDAASKRWRQPPASTGPLTSSVSKPEASSRLSWMLVNNAGVWTAKPSIDPEAGPEAFGKAMFDESIDAWQKAFLTNATSLYFVTAAFLPLLAQSMSSPTGKMGSVINNTSNSGFLRM